jgi:hypothetical protein
MLLMALRNALPIPLALANTDTLVTAAIPETIGHCRDSR